MREPNPRLARARRREAELLPQFTRLAAEGRSSREIARTVGVPKSTEVVFMGIGRDKLLYVDAILDHIVLDQLVRKTIVFCEQKRPEMLGIEAEQFQELLVHEFRRQCDKLPVKWPVYALNCGGVAKIPRIRRLTQYVINRELRFKADSPGCRLLVDQLMDFPLGEHDDGPDALEMCTRLPLAVMS